MKKSMYLFCVTVALISFFSFVQVSSAENSVSYNWSGCYFGINVGGGSINVKQTNIADDTAWGDMLPGENVLKTTGGFIGGGQGGCNIQVKQFVFGLEATAAGTTLEAKSMSSFGAADDSFKARIDFLMSATARAGFAVDKFLFYAKGGYAGALANLSVEDNTPVNTGKGKTTPWLSGWTAGGGVEYAITKNLIAGIEYNYISLAKKRVNYGDSSGPYSFDAKINDFHQGLIKLSYKFNWL
jgi:outer membrane immunogenic protein